MDEEIRKIMGVCDCNPAGTSDAGEVEEGDYGLVVLTREGADHLPEYAGKVLYYDDDSWHWLCEDDLLDLSEEEMAALEGYSQAIVYLGEPLTSPVVEMEFEWIRPATPEECLAHQLQKAQPQSPAEA